MNMELQSNKTDALHEKSGQCTKRLQWYSFIEKYLPVAGNNVERNLIWYQNVFMCKNFEKKPTKTAELIYKML